MITTCQAAGVSIIAGEHISSLTSARTVLIISRSLDTIFNHMTGDDSGTGVAGSSFTHYDYPGIYETQDFHYCGLEPDNNIVNYDNEVEVYTCQLDGLAE